MQIRKCKGCNAEMDVDAIFCNDCGLAAVGSGKSIGVESSSIAGARPSFSLPNAPIVDPGPTPSSAERPRIEYWRCPKCEADISGSTKYCAKCGFNLRPQPEPLSTQPPLAPVSLSAAGAPADTFSPDLVGAVRRRYREGYIYARFLDGFGVFVIVIGVILGVVVGFIGITAGAAVENQTRNSMFGGPSGGGVVVGVIICALGVVFGGIFVILGMILRAGAQHLKASFDGAVNGSPFLTNMDRAQMMSLPTPGNEKKTLNETAASATIYDDQPSGRFKAVAAYGLSFIFGILWIAVPIILFYITKDNHLVRFHSIQSVLLTGVSFASSILLFIPSSLDMYRGSSETVVGVMQVIIWLASIGANAFCMWKAYNGEEFKIPVIGDLAMNIVERNVERRAW